MNRFNTEELKALRRSAAALNKSDYEITKRLENVYDHILLMLEALHDQSSTQTLRDIDNGIDILLERLTDTQTILHYVLRERELEQKLASVDLEAFKHYVELESLKEVLEDEEPSLKERIIEKLKSGERVFEDDDGPDPLAADPEVLRRIKQRQQLESLIDSLYVSPDAERIKKMLLRAGPLKTRRELPYLKLPTRPHRDLNTKIPTVKGEGYEPPKTPDPK